MSHDMTKPTKWLCAQPRLRSAWASTQSDQSLRCALNGQLRTQGCFVRTAKTLIRLGRCPGWSESSLGTHFVGFDMSRLCYSPRTTEEVMALFRKSSKSLPCTRKQYNACLPCDYSWLAQALYKVAWNSHYTTSVLKTWKNTQNLKNYAIRNKWRPILVPFTKPVWSGPNPYRTTVRTKFGYVNGTFRYQKFGPDLSPNQSGTCSCARTTVR